MNNSISISKITGISNERGWSQIYEFDDLTHEATLLTEKMMAIFTFSDTDNSSQVESVRVGREVAMKLKSFYESQRENTIFESLKTTVSTVYAEYASKFGNGGFQMVVAVVSDNNVYVSMCGGGSVYSYQDKTLSRILFQEGGLDEISVSGLIANNIVIIGTKAFSEDFANNNNLEKILKDNYNDTLDNVVDALTSEIRKENKYEQVAAIILQKAHGSELLTKPFEKLINNNESKSAPIESALSQTQSAKNRFNKNLR